MTRVLAALLLLAAAGALLPAPASAAAPVATIQIDGVISPVTVRLVEAALTRAQAMCRFAVIQLAPLGSLSSCG